MGPAEPQPLFKDMKSANADVMHMSFKQKIEGVIFFFQIVVGHRDETSCTE